MKDRWPRRIPFGGDYNPDQWDSATWVDDLRLMRHFHVNTVTLPVFAWAKLQPAEDRFEFGWLDDILGRLERQAIDVILATPTAAQPAWMVKKYPEVSNVSIDGHRMAFGARSRYCPNSPVYRRLSRGIAAAMAKRYRDRKCVVLWHVNNEYGNEYSSICYCDNCAVAFRRWLADRYGSLDELNRRWYSAFWGHTYTDWDEIAVPSHLNEEVPLGHGDRDSTYFQPITIDYHRFISDSLLGCYRNEASAIREAMPGVPVTTNFMATHKPIDYFSWANDIDVVTWDSYPFPGSTPEEIAFRHDLMRGVKGRSFLLLEQTPNQTNWQPYNPIRRPGQMRLWSYQALAHGSDSVLYFQWRQSVGSSEKYHAAMVPHCGHEKTRAGREVLALGEELDRLGPAFIGADVRARAAILFDWSNWWAVDYSSGPTRALSYIPQVQKWYGAFHRQNIALDVARPSENLSRYSVVVAPSLVMADRAVRDNLRSFVEGGGTLITTFFSGIVDENDLVIPGGYPGAFRDFLGIWVEETDALLPGAENQIRVKRRLLPTKKERYTCGLVCDLVHAEGARILAVFGRDFYAGSPAVTENSFGRGKAVYVATDPAESFLEELIHHYSARAGILPTVKAPAGVEIVVRENDQGRFLFLLNHGVKSARVSLGREAGVDLLSGRRIRGPTSIPARGVMILNAASQPE